MPSLLDYYRKRYRRATDRARPSGERRLEGFDPREYARETGRAIYQESQEEFDKGMRDLVSSQVGQGRVRTGFGMEDRDRYIDDWQENLARSFATLGQRAAGQQIDAAGLEQRQRERYYDLVAGGIDREQARENARRKRKGGLFGGLGSLAGGIAGQFLLPGIGAETGAMIGGELGGAAGSYF